MTQDLKDAIFKAFKERNAELGCPRCGTFGFNLVDGFINQTVQDQLSGLTIGGPSIPSIVIVCKNCGFMSQHALGALGLLKPKEDNK